MANGTSQRVVFVAPGTVERMVMDHADDRRRKGQKGLNGFDIRQGMEIDDIWFELVEHAANSFWSPTDGQLKTSRKCAVPGFVTPACLLAIQESDGVTAPNQFVGGDLDVCLGTPKSAKVLMNEKEPHGSLAFPFAVSCQVFHVPVALTMLVLLTFNRSCFELLSQ